MIVFLYARTYFFRFLCRSRTMRKGERAVQEKKRMGKGGRGVMGVREFGSSKGRGGDASLFATRRN